MTDPVVISLAAVLVCEGFGLLAFARLGKLHELGFRTSAPPMSYFAGLVVAGLWIYAAWIMPAVRHWAFHVSALKFFALPVALTAGLFEEAFFRGYVMNALQKAGRGKAAQVLISGLSFGMAHAIWGLPAAFGGHADIRAFLMPVISTTTGGTALAAVYIMGERSLGPVVMSHFLVDATIEPGLLITAFSHH